MVQGKLMHTEVDTSGLFLIAAKIVYRIIEELFFVYPRHAETVISHVAMLFITLISRSGQLIITAANLVLRRGSWTSLMSTVWILVSTGDVNAQIEPVIGREPSLMLINALDPFVSFFWGLTVVASLKMMATSH